MRRNKNKPIKEYWASFTDVITNLLLVFTFVFIILIMKNYFDNVEINRLRDIVGTIENDLDDLRNSFSGFEIEGPDQDGNLRIVLGENLVKFPSSSARVERLPKSGVKVLKEVGQQIKDALEKHPSLFTVTIEGYTDTVGSEDDNYRLSYQRAVNVMNFWKDEVGLDPNKNDITPAGFGEMHSKLRVKTGNFIPKSKNRRIEIRITPKFKELMKHIIGDKPLRSDAKYLITYNKYGAKLTTRGTTIYLGKTCDAQSKKHGKGTWKGTRVGIEFKLKNQEIFIENSHIKGLSKISNKQLLSRCYINK